VRPDHDLRIGAQQERVAVGGCAGRDLHGEVAVGARTVLHDDRLAERLAELRREQAGERVGGAARRIGHVEANRARRVLRVCASKNQKGEYC
jgi:hypothetical protein